MQVQDLRIGNYIRHNVTDDLNEGKFIEPNEDVISEDDMMHFVGGLGLCDAAPIELTEEWLKKFGFELSVHLFHFYEQKIARGDCNTFVMRVWFNNRWIVGLYGHDGGIDYPIKYVHQLQNLFHSLTGNELTIQ